MQNVAAFTHSENDKQCQRDPDIGVAPLFQNLIVLRVNGQLIKLQLSERLPGFVGEEL